MILNGDIPHFSALGASNVLLIEPPPSLNALVSAFHVPRLSALSGGLEKTDSMLVLSHAPRKPYSPARPVQLDLLEHLSAESRPGAATESLVGQ